MAWGKKAGGLLQIRDVKDLYKNNMYYDSNKHRKFCENKKKDYRLSLDTKNHY